jgi:hypothetical protein
MRATTFLTFVFFTLFSVTFSQNKTTTFSFKSTVPATLFESTKTDLVPILVVDKQNKLLFHNHSYSYKVNPLPKNFNWSADIRKFESYKELILNVRRQDLCGRDLPVDVHYEVTQQVYFRILSDH